MWRTDEVLQILHSACGSVQDDKGDGSVQDDNPFSVNFFQNETNTKMRILNKFFAAA